MGTKGRGLIYFHSLAGHLFIMATKRVSSTRPQPFITVIMSTSEEQFFHPINAAELLSFVY